MNVRQLATIAKYMVCPDFLLMESSKSYINRARDEFFNYPYRHLSDRYSADSPASCDELLRNICNALNKVGDKRPVLLLSDGKDSMSLAVAFAEMGKSVDTLTLLRDDDIDLRQFVTDVAKKLGHRPYFVTSSEVLSLYSKESFLDGCGHMEQLVLDQGFLYFLFGIKHFWSQSGLHPSDCVVVDGLGNDETLGYIPSRNQLRSLQISRLGLWKFMPMMSKSLGWYFRSPSESHGDLSALSCFFNISQALPVSQVLSNLDYCGGDKAIIDYRAFVRGKFHDHYCMMGKTRAAAAASGCEYLFPWLDNSLAKFSFNLPEEYKFNFKLLKNKLLLRKLLEEKIGWQQEKRGIDLYFELDEADLIHKLKELAVPENLLDPFMRGKLLPRYVYKRALLEFLNLVGFCKANNISMNNLEEILS